MKFEIMPRASGKTTRLLEWLQRGENRIMITFSEKERDRLHNLVAREEMPIDAKKQIHSWHSYMKQKHGLPALAEIAIDNVDELLQAQCNHIIVHVTASDHEQ